METKSFILPSLWASYIVNGDSSGLDGSEVSDCDFFLVTNGLTGKSVSCADNEYFSKWNDANKLAALVREYKFLI
jgi:hypothetical protein